MCEVVLLAEGMQGLECERRMMWLKGLMLRVYTVGGSEGKQNKLDQAVSIFFWSNCLEVGGKGVGVVEGVWRS